MRLRRKVTLCQMVMVLFGLLPMARAGQAGAPTLLEQLQAQYKLVKMGADAGGRSVLEPGIVLVIQKGGILGVQPTSLMRCPQKYQDGSLHAPSGLCASMVKNVSGYFQTGSKVYPLKIDVNLKNEKVGFAVVACDSCNGTNPPTFYKGQVDFEFTKGALENPDVSKIEDTIGEVFSIDNSGTGAEAQQSAPAGGQAPNPSPAPAPAGPALTNADVIKLVAAKLPDSIIIKKIKSSACNFDTGTDGLIKLKQAGVSDAVIQAMVEKQ
jgi:hypothetical protein